MDEWVCGICRSVNLKFATSCYSCATPRRVAEAAFHQSGSAVPPAPAATAAAPAPAAPPAFAGAAGVGPIYAPSEAAAAAGYTFAPPVDPAAARWALLGGLVLGLLAAVGATALWYGVVALTEYQIAFVAIGVGWLVGTGTIRGARGGVSFLLVVSSGLFTLGALAVSEYLIVDHFAKSVIGVPISEIFASPLDAVIESLSADPLTLVFWAIALFVAVAIPFRSLISEA